MNNRQTLYLLIGLTVVAAGGRLYMGKVYGDYQTSFQQGKAYMKYVHETTDDLSNRLNTLAVAASESGFRRHFQKRAIDARTGPVQLNMGDPRPTRGISNAVDRSFTITFQDDARFLRDQLRHFLFYSEDRMPRMRTTTLNIQPHNADGGRSRARRMGTGADRDDVWTVKNMVFTLRSPVTKDS